MRKWERAFRRASFKGVGFWVDSDGPESGRRVSIHEISGGDLPVIEDMGRVTKTFNVSAYVASDLADLEGLLLETVCDTPGAGVLILPMDAFQTAFCTGCRRDRRKDENGYIAYDLSFVEAGAGGVLAMAGLSVLRDAFSTGLSSVGAVLKGAI